MRNKIFTIIAIFFIGLVLIAAPNSNPYAERYPDVDKHWTYGVDWANVVNILDYGAVADGTTDNLSALHSAIDDLTGEGIIYFPEGNYYFSDDIVLPSGVILRGDKPSVTDAVDSDFEPLSKLLFPEYVPAFTGNGTPDSTAFKAIVSEADAKNTGLVYLDINRARIEFKPHSWEFTENSKGNTTVNSKKGTYLGVGKPSNVIVFGCRSNNVAIPDNRVGIGANGTWERFSWRFAANIDLYVEKNGCICNNRINDNITDNYKQPGYLDNLDCGGDFSTDGSGAMFDYTKHYGIVLNRAKTNQEGSIEGNYVTGGHNDWGVMAFITRAAPEDEPALFAPGNEIRDNWIYRTRRIGIHGAGNGLEITGNEIYDKKDKKNYLKVDGTACNVNNSATLENRGIDFSGWNVLVDSNYLEAFVDRLGGSYPSIDGEGILMQECCGGTVANDYTITNNTIVGDAPNNTNPAISLYKMGPINNILIRNNEVSDLYSSYNGFIFISSNTNNNDYELNNAIIDSNTAKSINISAIEGYNVNVQDNYAWSSNAAEFSAPCWVDLYNNVGFASYDTAGGACAQTNPTVIEILTNSQAVDPGNSINIDFSITSGDLNSTFDLYQGDTIISQITANNGTASYSWVAPMEGGYYYLFASVDNYNSKALEIEVDIPDATSTKVNKNSSETFSIYPNPAAEYINVNSRGEFIIYDSLGKVIKRGNNTTSRVNISSFNKGIYFVKVGNRVETFVKR